MSTLSTMSLSGMVVLFAFLVIPVFSSTWADFSMVVHQAERDGHRIAIQIDSKEYAGIAIHYTARSGWMFSKVPMADLFKTKTEPIMFFGKDQRPMDEGSAYLLASEDFLLLKRTGLKGFKGCPKGEAFNLEAGGKKYYLMAVKVDLSQPDSEKVIGTFIGEVKVPNGNEVIGKFFGMDKANKKLTLRIASQLTPDHVEVFCPIEHKGNWKDVAKKP